MPRTQELVEKKEEGAREAVESLRIIQEAGRRSGLILLHTSEIEEVGLEAPARLLSDRKKNK